MGLELQWAGMVAGSLIAIGTVLRWLWLRVTRAARWTAAMVELPEQVDRLRQSVDTLRASVDTLAHAVEPSRPASPVTVSLERVR